MTLGPAVLAFLLSLASPPQALARYGAVAGESGAAAGQSGFGAAGAAALPGAGADAGASGSGTGAADWVPPPQTLALPPSPLAPNAPSPSVAVAPIAPVLPVPPRVDAGQEWERGPDLPGAPVPILLPALQPKEGEVKPPPFPGKTAVKAGENEREEKGDRSTAQDLSHFADELGKGDAAGTLRAGYDQAPAGLPETMRDGVAEPDGAAYFRRPALSAAPAPAAVPGRSTPLPDQAVTGSRGKRILARLFSWVAEEARGLSLPAAEGALMNLLFDKQGLAPRRLSAWLSSQLPLEEERRSPVGELDMDVLQAYALQINAALAQIGRERGLNLAPMRLGRVKVLEDLLFVVGESPEARAGRLQDRRTGETLPDLRHVVAFHDAGLAAGEAGIYVYAGFMRLDEVRSDPRFLAAAILHEHLAMAGLPHRRVARLVSEATGRAFAGRGGAVSDSRLQALALAASAVVREKDVHGQYLEEKSEQLVEPFNSPRRVLRSYRGTLAALAVLALAAPLLYLFFSGLTASLFLGAALLVSAFWFVPMTFDLLDSIKDEVLGANFVPVSLNKFLSLPFDARRLSFQRLEDGPAGRREAVFKDPQGWEVRMIIGGPVEDGARALGIEYVQRKRNRGGFVWVRRADDDPDVRFDGGPAVAASRLRMKLLPHFERALSAAGSAEASDYLRWYAGLLRAKERAEDEAEVEPARRIPARVPAAVKRRSSLEEPPPVQEAPPRAYGLWRPLAWAAGLSGLGAAAVAFGPMVLASPLAGGLAAMAGGLALMAAGVKLAAALGAIKTGRLYVDVPAFILGSTLGLGVIVAGFFLLGWGLIRILLAGV